MFTKRLSYEQFEKELHAEQRARKLDAGGNYSIERVVGDWGCNNVARLDDAGLSRFYEDYQNATGLEAKRFRGHLRAEQHKRERERYRRSMRLMWATLFIAAATLIVTAYGIRLRG